MFSRVLSEHVAEAARQFPVTVVTGPRQSGKTTLLRLLFPEKPYVSMESPDTYLLALEDPRGFLARAEGVGMIIDEAQKCPSLFSYIQEIVDLKGFPGMFVLSGSQNFLLSSNVSQSLAGRCAILVLLPLSYGEFVSRKAEVPSLWEYLFKGSYPRPYYEKLDIRLWLQSYLSTYVEKDVRDILNVKNLATFQRFLKLCAGRHGQLLNIANLAVDAGISQATAHEWLSILESSYLIFRLQPHHENFKKRLVKMPKLYFYDSGLVCHLLDIDSPSHLSIHSMRGAIFEGWVLSECQKFFYHHARIPHVFFWRDHQGDEVDCLIERGERKIIFEIKSSQTPSPTLLEGLKRWQKISAQEAHCAVIYGGDASHQILDFPLLSWKDLDTHLTKTFAFEESAST